MLVVDKGVMCLMLVHDWGIKSEGSEAGKAGFD